MYIVSLSRSGLDDEGLAELISALPERCIALMEDIDAAFHHGLNRESPSAPPTQTPEVPDQPQDMQRGGPPVPSGNRVSLSGLLNALDGIGAQEGRVLFATTNKYSSLDPALCRPGRMDLHIEFQLASRFQAQELFKRFYAPSSSSSTTARATRRAPNSRRVNVDVGSEDPQSNDLIDLSELRTPTPRTSASLPSPSASATSSISEKTQGSESRGPTYVGISHRSCAPELPLDHIHALAVQFADAVPERELSMASLQGFLMVHKTRPTTAVEDVGAWVEKELATRKRVDGERSAGG